MTRVEQGPCPTSTSLPPGLRERNHARIRNRNRPLRRRKSPVEVEDENPCDFSVYRLRAGLRAALPRTAKMPGYEDIRPRRRRVRQAPGARRNDPEGRSIDEERARDAIGMGMGMARD